MFLSVGPSRGHSIHRGAKYYSNSTYNAPSNCCFLLISLYTCSSHSTVTPDRVYGPNVLFFTSSFFYIIVKHLINMSTKKILKIRHFTQTPKWFLTWWRRTEGALDQLLLLSPCSLSAAGRLRSCLRLFIYQCQRIWEIATHNMHITKQVHESALHSLVKCWRSFLNFGP